MSHHEVKGIWPGPCFGCSPANPHGLRLRFTHTEKGCQTRFTAPEELCGFTGMVHGGIIATLLDEVSAWAMIAYLGRLGATREMTTRYLKPVPTGVELIVTGTVAEDDAKGALIRARISNGDGVVLAEGESSWAFMKLSRIAALAKVDEGTFAQFLADCCPQREEP